MSTRRPVTLPDDAVAESTMRPPGAPPWRDAADEDVAAVVAAGVALACSERGGRADAWCAPSAAVAVAADATGAVASAGVNALGAVLGTEAVGTLAEAAAPSLDIIREKEVGTPRTQDLVVSCVYTLSSDPPTYTFFSNDDATAAAAADEDRDAEVKITRTPFGDVLHVRSHAVHFDIGLSGFCRQETRQHVKPYDKRLGGYPYMPEAQTGCRYLHAVDYFDTLPGGHLRHLHPAEAEVRSPQWSAADRRLIRALGAAPSPEDTVACAEYSVRYMAALRDDPPPGILGARLEYEAEVAVAQLERERQWALDPVLHGEDTAFISDDELEWGDVTVDVDREYWEMRSAAAGGW